MYGKFTFQVSQRIYNLSFVYDVNLLKWLSVLQITLVHNEPWLRSCNVIETRLFMWLKQYEDEQHLKLMIQTFKQELVSDKFLDLEKCSYAML